MDDKKTLADLKAEIAKFVQERNWDRFQNLRALAISLSLEANEFLDHFQWLSDSEVESYEKDESKREEIEEGLCDILSYLLITASKMDIDLSSAFTKKLEKNRKKYPVEEFSKNLTREEDSKKYQELRKKFMQKKKP